MVSYNKQFKKGTFPIQNTQEGSTLKQHEPAPPSKQKVKRTMKRGR